MSLRTVLHDRLARREHDALVAVLRDERGPTFETLLELLVMPWLAGHLAQAPML